jgi:hypothetical protein
VANQIDLTCVLQLISAKGPQAARNDSARRAFSLACLVTQHFLRMMQVRLSVTVACGRPSDRLCVTGLLISVIIGCDGHRGWAHR